MAGRVGKSSEIRHQGMTETTLALIADRTAWRMKLAGSRGSVQQQQRTRVLKQKIQHSVRKEKRMYLELLASHVQKAVTSGNMRAAYKAYAVRASRQTRITDSPPIDRLLELLANMSETKFPIMCRDLPQF